jgi:hypothetical protein
MLNFQTTRSYADRNEKKKANINYIKTLQIATARPYSIYRSKLYLYWQATMIDRRRKLKTRKNAVGL